MGISLRSLPSPRLRAELAQAHDRHLELLLAKRNRALEAGSVGLEATLRAQAVLGFLAEGDIDGFHHRMHLAAATRRRLLECARRGMRLLPVHRTLRASRPAFEAALASGDGELLGKLAAETLASASGVDEKGPAAAGAGRLAGFEEAFEEALRRLALGDREGAAEPFAQFRRSRGTAMDGHEALVAGLLAGDAARFNAGLGALLKARRALPARADLERWIAVDLLALARLGLACGLEVTGRDPLVPGELLGHPEAVFPDPSSLLPAIPDEFLDVSAEDAGRDARAGAVRP